MSIDLTDAVKAIRPYTGCCVDCPHEHGGVDIADAQALLAAALPHLEKQIREQVARELLLERDHARHAHRSAAANSDHFAHDYCRWVGHAEALTSAAARIARREGQ